MRLILTSSLHPNIGDYVAGTVAFVPDAAGYAPDGTPYVSWEWDELVDHGLRLELLPVATTPREKILQVIAEVDALYVAGGDTFALARVFADKDVLSVVADAVRGGLTYIGTSAGALMAGPSVVPSIVMDPQDCDVETVPTAGFGLTTKTVIPHVGGGYPIELVAETVRRFGEDYDLVLLKEGQALVVTEQERNNSITYELI